MKRNPVIHVGVVLIKPEGIMPELAPVRHRTLLGICRKLMAPGLYRDQEMDGRRLLQRLLGRAGRPSALEVIIGVLLAARMCDQDIDPRVRAIIAVVDIGTNPEDYPVEVLEEPLDHDLQDADGIAAFVASLVPGQGTKGRPDSVFS
ncbi:hypothetical protein [Skermanella pratensis]|uniref:hypothetical protein n=1 Tax=Skermanella pratensis TaxID=2233999 RepID=UPI0013019465|nr:hypothetical protein [Skermanella pratensis]